MAGSYPDELWRSRCRESGGMLAAPGRPAAGRLRRHSRTVPPAGSSRWSHADRGEVAQRPLRRNVGQYGSATGFAL